MKGEEEKQKIKEEEKKQRVKKIIVWNEQTIKKKTETLAGVTIEKK